ncbi:MAG TPA: UPF0182 family protein, partial [Actinomycetota bacterium]
LPVIAGGLLALGSISAGAAYPAFVQRFRVAPQEFQREQEYIVNNIEATRTAFGLDRIGSVPRSLSGAATVSDVESNHVTIDNIRLWRPDILIENYNTLQRLRRYYSFRDIDVDRYVVDGERRLVMLSAREIAQNEIPGTGGTWQNRHLVYTHGFGAAASQVNAATAEGQPVFLLKDIPPAGQPGLEGNGPRIYYGEGQDVAFVVVDSGADELDYQGTPADDQEQVSFNYDGEGGIPIGGLFQRALFAWRFRDVNLLISDLIQGESRIMIFRDIRQRVPKAAPFLQYDGDPYAAIVDGRLVWIWDAYTTTNQYPYSEPVDLEDVTTPGPEGAPRLSGSTNYIRNSVKVVVDAYDGTMTYYVVDETDPIIRVWRKAFPDLFTPLSEASEGLLSHFRYPENLFQVQAERFTNYHVTDPDVFYGKQDFWALPVDPAVSSGEQQFLMRPYYVLMRLPGQAEESFVLIMPFTPEGRQNMVAWLAANSDPGDDYGEVISFEFPAGVNVDGPTQIFARLNQDSRFARERTLLGQQGSSIRFGDFLVVPLEDTLVYVQPVYVQSDQPNAIPELKFVLVVNGSRVGLGSTLRAALADSLDEELPPTEDGEEEPPPGEGTIDQQVEGLLAEAADHFAAAEEALRDGNLARYQTEIEAAQTAVLRAVELLGGIAEPTGTPTPSPSP